MPVALITGASRGLGQALSLALARRGWSLIVDARTGADLDLAAEELRDAGAHHVVAVTGSVADAEHRARLTQAAHDAGRLDLLVNNASLLGPSPQPSLADYPLEVLDQVYRVNLFAPLALVQTLLAQLRASSGRVINVTSDAAVEPYDGWGGYGSSKAALDQLTAILGAEEPDLRVYAFDPGDMRTAMHQEAFPGEDISDRPPPDTVVPALLRLVDGDVPSGRHRGATLKAHEEVT
ncbi:MAG: SDR family oxidoreductase [Nocardioidaceae bacterium]|nr:SDR family oxidoreductase [Nocardioidaceae bacterium]